MSRYNRIILIGPMGAGKTSVGKLLASILGLNFFDSDLELQQKANCSIHQFFENFGELAFRQQETEVISNIIQTKNFVFATGGGSVLSAANREMLSTASFVCYLKVSPDIQQQRLFNVIERPLLPRNSAQRLEFFEKNLLLRAPLYESIADVTIDTNMINIEAVADQIIQMAN